MTEKIDLLSINAVLSICIALCSSFAVTADQLTGLPSKIVLNIAMDVEKANSNSCEFPVFMSADENFHSSAHLEMLSQFQNGQPFVPVEFTNLSIYKSQGKDGYYRYFGTATTFEVTSKDRIDYI